MQANRSGRVVHAAVSVWFDEETGQIHLAVPRTDWFHTTVNAEDGSARCHKSLFAKLGRLLAENGAPAPDPGLTPDYSMKDAKGGPT